MEAINLNLIPNGTNPVVHCSQYDEGREFRFNLFDGASVFVLDGTEDITCDIKKPDGNIVTAAVPNTEDDYIIVTTTLQMCACSGNSLGTINISKGGVNLYTLNFVLYCERSPLENGIESDSAIHNLESQVEDIVSEQYDSANVIFDSVPTSGHGTPYVVSSDGLLSYIPKNVSDMDDVTITTPVQGEALVFDADGNLVNGTVSTVGSIDDLNDVDTTGKVDGDSLRYDSGSGDWVAKPTTIALTQAEYDALALSGDLVPNTHYVITDAPNLNPTASDIEYSGAVTVKQAIDSKADTSTTYTKTEVDNKVAKYFDLTASSTVSDSGISPFSFYGQPTKTDSNIHNILSVTVIDTQFNNPAIAVLYGQSGSTFTFMVYSARSGNVKIRVAYN